MGSPEKPNKSTISIIASTTSPQSAAFQDSPIFNYINNLSPIKPVKGTSVTQFCPGLNSPPFVFTSPRIHGHQQSIDLKRSPCHLTPFTNSSLNDSQSAPPEVADSMNTKGSMETYDNEDDEGSDEVAVDPSPTFDGQVKEGHEGNLPYCPKPDKNNGEQSDFDPLFSQQYDQRVAQHMKPIFGNTNCGDRSGSGIANKPIPTMIEQHSKVGQNQLGKRRRLQFEMTQDRNVENNPVSQNASNNATGSEVLESSCDNIQNTINATVNVSKPSGIGLHLNSIVNARPSGNISIKLTKGSVSSAREKKSLMQNDIQYPSISSSMNIEENVLARSEEFTHETPVSYNNAKSLKIVKNQEKFDHGSLKSEQVERVNEFDRSNPKKKRKKTDNSGDGCKRCNCKKSKCLKLYCDCFAAGIYCSDPCSCQGCFNRPEYEETVIETRQLIESRNPLAFAPKIVTRPSQPPKTQTLEEGEQVTPLAGRHKKGCNCKKSMCLKKYCECYQSNVGCSDGCRCEGCQNIYGVKKGSGMNREMGMEAIDEKLNDSFDDNLKVGPTGSKPSLPEFHKPHNLTPQTPSFQNSNHGKDPTKTRIFTGRYDPSPESESNFYPPPYLTTPLTQPQTNNLEIHPSNQEPYQTLEFMDEFAPTPPLFSSLCFRGTLFGGAKNIMDDDTPNILQESFTTEVNKVKVRSPNKKRISPPRIRLHELGSSSLKSGRKFILKAVPSFPPLTPCIDSKDDNNTRQNHNDNNTR